MLRLPFILACALAVVLTFGAYAPGLSGGFIFDDTPNILHNSDIQIRELSSGALKKAFFSGESGPLKRPISMLSFALNHYFTGLDPYYFKLTNVIIHMLSGLGLFFLTRNLLTAYRRHILGQAGPVQPNFTENQLSWISLAVAAVWLLHPLNMTGVLYIVQRMASLSALFTIWGLVLFTRGRLKLLEGKPGIFPILLSFALFTPLAALAKENGLLLPLYMGLIELTLFRLGARSLSSRRFLAFFFSLAVILPALFAAVYLMLHPEWFLNGYQGRPFSFSERLLTESRVLWLYLKMILLPNGSQLSLFHDDILLSRDLLTPPTTLFAVIGLLGLFGIALWALKHAPLLSFGILFFFAGHLLESTLIPLEIMHEHRNYLPQYGILLAAMFYLLYPLAHLKSLRPRQAFAVLMIGLLGMSTAARAAYWGNGFEFSLVEVIHHPNSPRANYQAATVYATLAEKAADHTEDYYRKAEQHFWKSNQLDANYLDGLFGLLLLQTVHGHLIDLKVIDSLAAQLKQPPFRANSVNQIVHLIQCQKKQNCQIPPQGMGRLIEAALENPNLTGRLRAIVLMFAADYLANHLGNYPDAIEMANQAIKAYPKGVPFRIGFIQLLIAVNRSDLAEEQIARAKALDRWGIYKNDLLALQKSL